MCGLYCGSVVDIGDHAQAAAAVVSLPVDRSLLAYRETTNLKEINEPDNLLYNLALDDWQHKQTDLAIKVSWRENKSVNLTNQIFIRIEWYAVF
jgi:hypothetical protein